MQPNFGLRQELPDSNAYIFEDGFFLLKGLNEVFTKYNPSCQEFTSLDHFKNHLKNLYFSDTLRILSCDIRYQGKNNLDEGYLNEDLDGIAALVPIIKSLQKSYQITSLLDYEADKIGLPDYVVSIGPTGNIEIDLNSKSTFANIKYSYFLGYVHNEPKYSFPFEQFKINPLDIEYTYIETQRLEPFENFINTLKF